MSSRWFLCTHKGWDAFDSFTQCVWQQQQKDPRLKENLRQALDCCISKFLTWTTMPCSSQWYKLKMLKVYILKIPFTTFRRLVFWKFWSCKECIRSSNVNLLFTQILVSLQVESFGFVFTKVASFHRQDIFSNNKNKQTSYLLLLFVYLITWSLKEASYTFLLKHISMKKEFYPHSRSCS